jgi:hypothetical protein
MTYEEVNDDWLTEPRSDEPRVYKTLIAADLFRILGATSVDWGEPDADGFYTPTVYRGAAGRHDPEAVRRLVEAAAAIQPFPDANPNQPHWASVRRDRIQALHDAAHALMPALARTATDRSSGEPTCNRERGGWCMVHGRDE